MDQKELFADYEISNGNWKKFIFKLLGVSLIFHVIILLFLIYVPAVRDAFYIALLFSDAPTNWVNKDYNKTQIEEGETASIISLPPADQLQYPAGYFNLANGDATPPDMAAMTSPLAPDEISTESSTIPGFPGLTINQPMATPTPFPIPSPIAGFPPINNPNSSSARVGLPKLRKVPKGAKLPEFSGVTEENKGGIPGIPQSSPVPSPEPNAIAKASPTPTPSPTTNADGINQKPLEDLAAKAIKQINDKEIDLNKTVNVTVKGVLNEKGELIAKQTSYKNNGGDEKLASMTAELIGAMNDSGMLKYVKLLSDGATKRDVIFNVSKDEKDVKFQIVSVVGDEAKANSIASGLNFGFGIFKETKKGTEEGELLNGVTFTTDKNQVIINWQMDAPTAMRKIQNKLDKIAAEQKTKPTSLTSVNSNAQAAIK